MGGARVLNLKCALTFKKDLKVEGGKRFCPRGVLKDGGGKKKKDRVPGGVQKKRVVLVGLWGGWGGVGVGGLGVGV